MPTSIDLQLTHIGIFVRDLERMSRFYCGLLGLVETDRGKAMQKHDVRFLTRDPNEHHQLVLATGRPDDATFSIVNQISFRAGSLPEMKAMHQRVTSSGIEIKRAVTHGNAWSMYFDDPEGNNIEVYTPSEWYVPQPFAHVADFTRAVEELVAENDRYVAQAQGAVPRATWSRALAARIAEQPINEEVNTAEGFLQ
jgi:catechol 2,3-dioxygenase